MNVWASKLTHSTGVHTRTYSTEGTYVRDVRYVCRGEPNMRITALIDLMSQEHYFRTVEAVPAGDFGAVAQHGSAEVGRERIIIPYRHWRGREELIRCTPDGKGADQACAGETECRSSGDYSYRNHAACFRQSVLGTASIPFQKGSRSRLPYAQGEC